MAQFPLDNKTGQFYTVKFKDDKAKEQLKIEDKLTEKVIQDHKISGTFDFTGVTEDELVNLFLCSTTSVLKMYQNNILKGMTEGEILTLAKTAPKVSVRGMLDGRSSKILTDEEKRKRFIVSQLKGGKTKEQIKTELMAMLEDIS